MDELSPVCACSSRVEGLQKRIKLTLSTVHIDSEINEYDSYRDNYIYIDDVFSLKIASFPKGTKFLAIRLRFKN